MDHTLVPLKHLFTFNQILSLLLFIPVQKLKKKFFLNLKKLIKYLQIPLLKISLNQQLNFKFF